jgi:hypothetical protein
MVTVSSLILSIRSKIGDTDALKQRFSDTEVVDNINDALNILSEELLWSTRTWTIPCTAGIGRYALPSDFLRPISAEYNGVLIEEIESLEHRKQNNHLSTGMAYDNRTLHIFPGENVQDGDNIALYYNNYETVNDETDTLDVANGYKMPIVYYALHLMHQNPISRDHMKKSSEYLSLYYARVSALKSIQRSNVQSKRMRNRYVKV